MFTEPSRKTGDLTPKQVLQCLLSAESCDRTILLKLFVFLYRLDPSELENVHAFQVLYYGYLISCLSGLAMSQSASVHFVAKSLSYLRRTPNPINTDRKHVVFPCMRVFALDCINYFLSSLSASFGHDPFKGNILRKLYISLHKRISSLVIKESIASFAIFYAVLFPYFTCRLLFGKYISYIGVNVAC